MSESEMMKPAANPVFVSTHWSVVLRAGRSDSPEAQAALAELCRNYWFPLYAYARRQGCDVHSAQDLTQEFFSKLIEKNYLNVADRSERGRAAESGRRVAIQPVRSPLLYWNDETG